MSGVQKIEPDEDEAAEQVSVETPDEAAMDEDHKLPADLNVGDTYAHPTSGKTYTVTAEPIHNGSSVNVNAEEGHGGSGINHVHTFPAHQALHMHAIVQDLHEPTTAPIVPSTSSKAEVPSAVTPGHEQHYLNGKAQGYHHGLDMIENEGKPIVAPKYLASNQFYKEAKKGLANGDAAHHAHNLGYAHGLAQATKEKKAEAAGKPIPKMTGGAITPASPTASGGTWDQMKEAFLKDEGVDVFGTHLSVAHAASALAAMEKDLKSKGHLPKSANEYVIEAGGEGVKPPGPEWAAAHQAANGEKDSTHVWMDELKKQLNIQPNVTVFGHEMTHDDALKLQAHLHASDLEQPKGIDDFAHEAGIAKPLNKSFFAGTTEWGQKDSETFQNQTFSDELDKQLGSSAPAEPAPHGGILKQFSMGNGAHKYTKYADGSWGMWNGNTETTHYEPGTTGGKSLQQHLIDEQHENFKEEPVTLGQKATEPATPEPTSGPQNVFGVPVTPVQAQSALDHFHEHNPNPHFNGIDVPDMHTALEHVLGHSLSGMGTIGNTEYEDIHNKLQEVAAGGPKQSSIVKSATPAVGSKKKTSVMAKNLKAGDQILLNGEHHTVVTKQKGTSTVLQVKKGIGPVHNISIAKAQKVTKLHPGHYQYKSDDELSKGLGGATPTSDTTELHQSPAITHSFAPAHGDFASAWKAAETLENKGNVLKEVPGILKAPEEALKKLDAYRVGKEVALAAAETMPHAKIKDDLEAAQESYAKDISQSAKANWLGMAHGFQQFLDDAGAQASSDATEQAEEVADPTETPEYASALAKAEKAYADGATSRDLYKTAGEFKENDDAARYMAWQKVADKADFEEGEKPLVEIAQGTDPLTPEGVAYMKAASQQKQAPSGSTDLHAWAYDQGRAMGISAGNTAVNAGGYTAADLENAALEFEQKALESKGLLQRKHQGIAKGLHRVANALYEGKSKEQGDQLVTTTKGLNDPKPNVKYTGPQAYHAPGSGHVGYPKEEAEFNAEEKAAFKAFTASDAYRFSKSDHKPINVALNKLLNGEDPGTGAGAKQAKVLLNAVETKSVPSKQTIMRGTNGEEWAPGQLQAWENTIKAGGTVDFQMPISSSTYGPQVWIGKKYRYFIDPGAMTVDGGPQGSYGYNELETMTGGLMQVYKIEHQSNGKVFLYMRQLYHYGS